MWGTLLDLARGSASYDDVDEMTATESIAHTVMGMGPDTNTVCDAISHSCSGTSGSRGRGKSS
jgi:hypothetical protein